jgi:hypothetical protein
MPERSALSIAAMDSLPIDEAQVVLTWVFTITLGFSLAACAGLRAFLPLLIAGMTARFTDSVELGDSFAFLSSTPALVVFGVATVAEIVGDKIPAVDHALDVFGTFARPAAGALLSAAVLYQVEDPLWALGIGICVGAPTAAVPHVVKSATRGLSSTLTFGLGNPVLSILEDLTAITIAIMAVVLPIVVGFSVLVIGLVVLAWIVRLRRARGTAAMATPAPA